MTSDSALYIHNRNHYSQQKPLCYSLYSLQHTTICGFPDVKESLFQVYQHKRHCITDVLFFFLSFFLVFEAPLRINKSSILAWHALAPVDEDVRASFLWQLSGQQWHHWTHTTYLADTSDSWQFMLLHKEGDIVLPSYCTSWLRWLDTAPVEWASSRRTV